MNPAMTATKPEIAEVMSEKIPKQLTRRPQWIVWRLELRGEKWTKVPYSAKTGRKASSTDLMTWGTFDETLDGYQTGDYDGIGFVFCSADLFVGVDLDECRDPETGLVEPWAQRIVDSFSEVYVEASPSGTGVHIIVEGELDEGMKVGPVEMYDQKRFFTVTGRTIS